MEPRFDAKKFKELILYIAEACQDEPLFGAVKLNKVLFFSDFLAYGKLGKSITGARYQRLELGPAPRQLLPTQKALENEGAAVLFELKKYTQTQKRLRPLRSADLALFSAQEIKLVDEVIEVLRHYTASEVSALSHLDKGWQIAEEGEDIPYEWVFLSTEPPTPAEVARAQQLAAEHGWLDRSA
jgi:hypothetical protein